MPQAEEYAAWRDIMLWIDRRTAGRRELPRPIQAGRKTTGANPQQTEFPNRANAMSRFAGL